MHISFSGELAYEINVPANQARHVWERLFAAGLPFGITPYGTETMHVLRAEKGFIIVGQDTDGSVSPVDLGMGWIIAKDKDFIGRRSLYRSDTMREDRKQLVGLLTEQPEEVLPEGGQIVATASATVPVPMLGHVTSSYFSASLGRSIALALVKKAYSGLEKEWKFLSQPEEPSKQSSRSLCSLTPKERVSMSDQVNRESPLVRFDGAGRAANKQVPGKVQAREHPFLGYLNLRGDATDVRFSTAVKTIAGADLPTVPNATKRGPDNAIYWLGPDEWLIVTLKAANWRLPENYAAPCRKFYFPSRISAADTSVVLSGSSVCELLAKDCPLDFDTQLFPPETRGQSRVAKAPVLVRRIDGSSFEIVIRRSFAEYFWLWVGDACAEYGLA